MEARPADVLRPSAWTGSLRCEESRLLIMLDRWIYSGKVVSGEKILLSLSFCLSRAVGVVEDYLKEPGTAELQLEQPQR